MTIRLYPVTGALGVEVVDDPEFWGKRNEMKPCKVKGHCQHHNELIRVHKQAADLYIVVPHS